MKTCQMTMGDGGKTTGHEHYWECGKPAKAWIPDQFKRTGWGGRQYLCGLHAAAYNKKAARWKKPLANPIARP